jgi:preprotein translocase subunit SecA
LLISRWPQQTLGFFAVGTVILPSFFVWLGVLDQNWEVHLRRDAQMREEIDQKFARMRQVELEKQESLAAFAREMAAQRLEESTLEAARLKKAQPKKVGKPSAPKAGAAREVRAERKRERRHKRSLEDRAGMSMEASTDVDLKLNSRGSALDSAEVDQPKKRRVQDRDMGW